MIHLRTYFMKASMLLASLVLICSGCNRGTASSAIPVGSIWDLSTVPAEVNWSWESQQVQDQQAGFILANQDEKLNQLILAEGNRQDDVQVAVRLLAEGNRKDPLTDPVLAMIGATSDQASGRMAALANFFNVPLLIPTTSGDALLPSTNLWAFQMSAPNSAYASYLMNTILTKQALLGTSSPALLPAVRIAILFDANTYGESAAVATATAIMAQGLDISVYEKFNAEDPDLGVLAQLASSVLNQNTQVVVLISSQPSVAKDLVASFTSLREASSLPVMIGLAGGFTSSDFLDSIQADSVYVLRQQLGSADCPSDIQSLAEGQTYAAVKLLEYAINEAPNVAKDKTKLSLSSEEGLIAYREAVRDALKTADINLPCLGQVAFDNSGQNKSLQFELLHGGSEGLRIVLPGELINAVQQRMITID